VSCIEDVLADAVLSGALPPGSTAHLDLDPTTGAPRCWPGGRPAEELPPVLYTSGDGVLVSVGRVAGGFAGGAPPPAYYDGADAAAGDSVYVLASGGFEEDE
jgi:hypothetical protein